MMSVGDKEKTRRTAVARGHVSMKPATLDLIARGKAEKGDVLAAARLAAIMAAKRAPDLVPLAHPISVTGVEVRVSLQESPARVNIEAQVETCDRAGVEMEALTAVCAAALTVVDMVKALDRDVTIGEVQLVNKSGGRSGSWERVTGSA